MSEEPKSTDEYAEQPREGRDARPGLVLGIAAIFLGGTAVAMLAAHFLLGALHREGPAPADAESWDRFPAPRVSADDLAALEAIRSAQKAELESFGWVDRDRGVVRIPIDRAVDRLLEEGLPETGSGKTRLDLLNQKANAKTEGGKDAR